MRSLKEIDAKGQVVFYRPDYNVPLEEGEIQDDFRIQATFPTLEYLMAQGARIVIGSHLGRPEGKPAAEFELRPVAERLADQYPDQTVRLAHAVEGPEVEAAIKEMEGGDLLLLPNLRFYPGEESNDPQFAATLAKLATLYVNDAFACDHRAHASIVGIPALLPGYAGMLLQHEVENLNQLLEKPAKPFVVIMGGAKVSDKIGVIKSLAKVADRILIGGAMANTFLMAKGEMIGESLAEPDKLDLAKELMAELGDKLVLAADYIKDSEDPKKFKYQDIGEQAIAQFQEELKSAKTIFWNGSLGRVEEEQFAKATETIATYIAGLSGVTSVIAGGDTVETVTKLGLHDKFTFVSTGGGAALELLAGAVLPGVDALEHSSEAAKEKSAAPEGVEQKQEAEPEREAESAEESAEEPMAKADSAEVESESKDPLDEQFALEITSKSDKVTEEPTAESIKAKVEPEEETEAEAEKTEEKPEKETKEDPKTESAKGEKMDEETEKEPVKKTKETETEKPEKHPKEKKTIE